MDTSIFTDLNLRPCTEDLKTPLGTNFQHWMETRDYVFSQYPQAMEEWHVSVKKYGWSFRIKDKKRAIVYLSPRQGYFKLVMVFGQKATDKILADQINPSVKEELMASKVYMEGRVLLLDIHDGSLINDIKKLIDIKLAI